MSQLAAGIAGGLAAGNSLGAVTGAQAGKNAVENNFLDTQYDDMALQNQKDILAASRGDEAAQKRVDARIESALKVLDFVPIAGDIKGLIEAQNGIEYLIATIAIVPGLGEAAAMLHEASVALKAGKAAEASQLMKQASDEIQSVKALDVGSYKELKAREVVGDNLEHDHIPSFAAIRRAKENELGRKLTPAEEKT